MNKHFSAEFFIANRQRLKQLFTGKAPIVLTAYGVLQRNGDVTFPFRQDSNFWYLTGIDEPDVILVIDKDKEYLILPPRNEAQNIFDGQIDLQELRDTSGITDIQDSVAGWRLLEKRLKKAKHVATLAPTKAYMEHGGFYANPTKARLLKRIKAINPDIKPLDLRPHLARMRVVKQPAELAVIEAAIRTTEKAIKAVQKRHFTNEQDLELALTTYFRRHGASGHGFLPIVASGQRACVLHNVNNNGSISGKDLLVLDVGAEVSHYSADITRTYSPTGRPTKRQRAVFEAVLAVQDYALSLVKPGAFIQQNEAKIEHFMGEKLRELGLIKTISKETVRQYYPHATSHFLGLDVHDVGDYQQPLAEGMVITVEPGIYIPEESIGVRIEDDVLVTKDGYRLLSGRLPRAL